MNSMNNTTTKTQTHASSRSISYMLSILVNQNEWLKITHLKKQNKKQTEISGNKLK